MKKHTVDVRGLNFHVQEWGDASKPTLFMLHGWMDCGATYKFVAPYLQDNYHIIAPDLRGFGQTDHAPGYWFPDYVADLHVLLDHFAPNSPVNLVGHSMGGNIVLMYAGINPQRVKQVLSLEAAGMPPTKPSDAVEKTRQWMGEILSDQPSKVYPNQELLKHSIYKGNPTLSKEAIDELAELWGKPVGDGGAWMLKHDHHHRYTNPVRYQFEDTMQIWQQVTARVGLVMAQESLMYQRYLSINRIEEAKQNLSIADKDYFLVENSAHMLHIEQPAATADCISTFFKAKA